MGFVLFRQWEISINLQIFQLISATIPPLITEMAAATYGGRTRIPTFNCTYCPSKYLSQSGVDAHIEKEHGTGISSMMQNAFSAYPQYNVSNNTPTYQGRKKIPDYKCPHCPVKYLSESGVQNHIVKVHTGANGEAPPPYVPPPENSYTPRRRSSTFNCNQCIKKYLSQDGLDQHVVREHNGKPGEAPPPPQYQPRKRSSTFNCTQCIKKYLSQDGLDAHIVKEHGGMSGDMLQPVDVTNLISHPTNNNTQRKRTSTFNCTQCISKYLTQDGLDAHVKKEHTPDEEQSNEDGLSWPPEKGSIIATLFEDNFYIGRVLRFEADNSAMVRYMERSKKTKDEDRYWVWPENHETFQTAQESVLGVDLIIEKDGQLSKGSEVVFELKDHETWSNLSKSCQASA